MSSINRDKAFHIKYVIELRFISMSSINRGIEDITLPRGDAKFLFEC